MSLEIVGAAFPRTGTVSLKLALEQLGFGPCHHMAEMIAHPEMGTLWIAAAEGRPDWDAIFASYKSCADAPSCFYWREILQKYPEAKVILTARDPEKWFESTQATVFSPEWIAATLKMPLGEFFQKAVYDHYDGRIHDHDFMVAKYKGYCDEVQRTVPPDRLLVHRTGEGWEPLCQFLGVPVPDTPYPQVNTREEMRARLSGAISKGSIDQSDIDDFGRH
jgi:Sulfotransferase domain